MILLNGLVLIVNKNKWILRIFKVVSMDPMQPPVFYFPEAHVEQSEQIVSVDPPQSPDFYFPVAQVMQSEHVVSWLVSSAAVIQSVDIYWPGKQLEHSLQTLLYGELAHRLK